MKLRLLAAAAALCFTPAYADHHAQDETDEAAPPEDAAMAEEAMSDDDAMTEDDMVMDEAGSDEEDPMADDAMDAASDDSMMDDAKTDNAMMSDGRTTDDAAPKMEKADAAMDDAAAPATDPAIIEAAAESAEPMADDAMMAEETTMADDGAAMMKVQMAPAASPADLAGAFCAAVIAEDANALSALYTEDADSYAPDGSIVKGRAAIAESWRPFFAAFDNLTCSLAQAGAAESDEHATMWGLWTMTGTPAEGGDAVEMKGRYMDIAVKTDGGWLYRADHASNMAAETE